MVISAEREKTRQAKAERDAEKERIRAAKESARAEKALKRLQESAEREQKKKEREALEAERESARAGKELKRRQELADREQKKKEREALEAERELKKREKEARKQQEEAEKEQRRREKESLEAERENKRKERELKRQQDETEKELKRKEKEAAERKKQLLLQKQANIMDRFVRRKEADTLSPQGKRCEEENGSLPSPDQMESNSTSEPAMTQVVLRLDEELRSNCIKSEDELLRNHVFSWQEKWKRRSAEPFRRWGVRLTPKITVFRELRLQGANIGSCQKTDYIANAGSCSNSEGERGNLKRNREEDGNLDDSKLEDRVVVLDDNADVICSPPRKKLCNPRWKLLQFDKSHRPAFYGTFSRATSSIKPRHPLRKDPSLDYEVDSDEEWEEEDPGESLSDCEDKEDESERAEPEMDEDAADGFVVPDGYLSENEGVHLEEADMEDSQNAGESISPGDNVALVESSGSLDQVVRKHQHLLKLLDNVTKHALQRNRPFLVSDLLQQPAENSANVENQTERLCFQALRMCIMSPKILVGPAAMETQLEVQGCAAQKNKDCRGTLENYITSWPFKATNTSTAAV